MLQTSIIRFVITTLDDELLLNDDYQTLSFDIRILLLRMYDLIFFAGMTENRLHGATVLSRKSLDVESNLQLHPHEGH